MRRFLFAAVAALAVWLFAAVGVDSAAYCTPENPQQCATPTPTPTPGLDPLGNDPPEGVPAPIQGKGYEVKFFDSFNTLDRTVWSNGIWYEPADPPGTQYVQDGVLHLDMRRDNGYVNVQATTDDTYSFLYGYIECRSRFNSGRGGLPGCWTLSQGWANTASCLTPSAEIDVFEGQTIDLFFWTGAIHRHSAQPTKDCGGNQQNEWNAFRHESERVADTWHTWAVEWTPDNVCWYFDDRLSHCAPPWDTFDKSPQFILLQSGGPGWMSGNNYFDTDSPDVLMLETNWVRVWQKVTP